MPGLHRVGSSHFANETSIERFLILRCIGVPDEIF